MTSAPVQEGALKPCPFCNHHLVRSEFHSNRIAEMRTHPPEVKCILSGIIISMEDREEDAERRSAWNMRAGAASVVPEAYMAVAKDGDGKLLAWSLDGLQAQTQDWRQPEEFDVVPLAPVPPLPASAQDIVDRFGRKTPVDGLALELFETWARSDPRSGPAQFPASYLATFADMARSAIAWARGKAFLLEWEPVENAPSNQWLIVKGHDTFNPDKEFIEKAYRNSKDAFWSWRDWRLDSIEARDGAGRSRTITHFAPIPPARSKERSYG